MNTITDSTTQATSTKAKIIYSIPSNVAAKEWMINESKRTGLTQKQLLDKAIDALKAASANDPTLLPNALPIVLPK